MDFSWNESDTVISAPIIITLLAFCLYWFTAKSKRIASLFYKNKPFDQASSNHVFFTKYFGFLSMGALPFIACLIFLPQYSLADFGVSFNSETTGESLFWILVLSVVLIPTSFISARQSKRHINYPQVRAKIWSRGILFKSLLGWFLYLFGYEFLFRGVLLIPLVDSIGLWPAIAINIALYSGTHIPKGLGETMGAIPFGLVLSLITISTGTIWVAFFAHLIIAWTNNLVALKYNPETNLIK